MDHYKVNFCINKLFKLQSCRFMLLSNDLHKLKSANYTYPLFAFSHRKTNNHQALAGLDKNQLSMKKQDLKFSSCYFTPLTSDDAIKISCQLDHHLVKGLSMTLSSEQQSSMQH